MILGGTTLGGAPLGGLLFESAGGPVVVDGSATLTATAGQTATGFSDVFGTATLGATAGQTVTGFSDVFGTATLGATASLVATGDLAPVTVEGTATLIAVGELAGLGDWTMPIPVVVVPSFYPGGGGGYVTVRRKKPPTITIERPRPPRPVEVYGKALLSVPSLRILATGTSERGLVHGAASLALHFRIIAEGEAWFLDSEEEELVSLALLTLGEEL